MVNSKDKWTLSPPVGAVSNRTASALLETVPTKRENGRGGFLTAPVWRVSLILRSTIIAGRWTGRINPCPKETEALADLRSVSS